MQDKKEMKTCFKCGFEGDELFCIHNTDANFKKCWALSNLRPYSAKQNVLDGVNRARHQK